MEAGPERQVAGGGLERGVTEDVWGILSKENRWARSNRAADEELIWSLRGHDISGHLVPVRVYSPVPFMKGF